VELLTARARSRSGRVTPDVASWYRVTLPANVDVESVLAEFRASPVVAHAAVAPTAARPPSTPDFFAQQAYLRPAPQGTDAEFSLRDPRTRGAGVRIVDLEYYWTADHEDLNLPATVDLGGAAFPQYSVFNDDHGTSVFGIMVADENGFGVTGRGT
jgi:serine protease